MPMKNIYFNELSLFDELNFNKEFLLSCVKFLKSNSVSTCKTDEEIRQYICGIKSLNRQEKALVLNFLKAPFYTSDDVTMQEDINYVNMKCTLGGCVCTGFLYAYSTGTFVLSFYSDRFCLSKYEVKIDDDYIKIDNVSCDDHFANVAYILNKNKEIVLLKSNLSLYEKIAKSKLSTDNHHGTKDLKEYMNSVLRNDYVEFVMTSISQSQSNKFLKVNEDLTIDIRLTWLDRHPGLKIVTTARSFEEATKICDILDNFLPKY